MPASRSARARSAEMCPTEAQRLRLVCSETRRTPSRYFCEVALGEALTLGDHAEAVCSGRLGGACVLEDLLGLHHRVHRRLGVGEARLGAEAAVLRAAARLGVDERAHVGRVGEALDAGSPGALDQRFDLRVILELAQVKGLLARDQRGHGRNRMTRGGRLAGTGGVLAGPARPPRAVDERAHQHPGFLRLDPLLRRSATSRSRRPPRGRGPRARGAACAPRRPRPGHQRVGGRRRGSRGSRRSALGSAAPSARRGSGSRASASRGCRRRRAHRARVSGVHWGVDRAHGRRCRAAGSPRPSARVQASNSAASSAKWR